MPLLPQDQKDQYRLLGMMAFVALGGVYYLYLHSPKSDELVELEARVEQIEHANELAESRMQDLDAVRRELEIGERQFAMLQRLVPSQAEVPAIYEAIASQSQSLGLELVSVTPTDPQPDTAGYFMHQNWRMQVEGEYHDIGEFLTRVASFDRIVRPDVEQILPVGETNSGRQLVTARFGLETFVIPPGGGNGGTDGE